MKSPFVLAVKDQPITFEYRYSNAVNPSERAKTMWMLALGALLVLAACSSRPTSVAHPQPVDQESRFKLTATIRDLMVAEVDPAADALWESVAFIASEAGTEDRQPRTDEEWRTVRRHAIILIEAANLLSMEGRRVAPVGSVAAPGELDPAQIQQRIDGNRASFVQFARLLQEAALQALTAIDAKDPKGLFDAGGTIDEACEACHVTYWYPNQTILKK